MLQEDLTVKDMEGILDDLKAGREPAAGPRSVAGESRRTLRELLVRALTDTLLRRAAS